MSLATAKHTNPLKKKTETTSFLKAKSLFIRVLMASKPAQYSLLRVQRYNYLCNQPSILSIFYHNEVLKKHKTHLCLLTNYLIYALTIAFHDGFPIASNDMPERKELRMPVNFCITFVPKRRNDENMEEPMAAIISSIFFVA